MGSVLLGRDIRDYYRNFILNPYSWWKTYAFALGSFWFNPYLPFGGSSCTSIAQRQSDAIRAVAKVYGVEAETLAMLDDFLLVVPRGESDSDETVLSKGQIVAHKFDKLLSSLGLPKAPEKDQPPAFTTIWYGICFNTKTGTYSLPLAKWEDLLKYFEAQFVDSATNSIMKRIEAAELHRALGKFHHATLVWTAGRPSLYAIWKLFYSAKFRSGAAHILQPKKQLLNVTPEAKKSLRYWRSALSNPPPERFMLKCSKNYKWLTLDIVKAKSGPTESESIWISLPACSWRRPERLLDQDSEYASGRVGRIAIWLEALLEGLEVMEVFDGTDGIVVRTNIRKLAESINKDLYVSDFAGANLAIAIHKQLAQLGKDLGRNFPLELRVALIPGGMPHPVDG